MFNAVLLLGNCLIYKSTTIWRNGGK